MKAVIILFLANILSLNLLIAQKNETVDLNKHFIAWEEGSGDIMYSKKINREDNGKVVERIYNLNEQLVQITIKEVDEAGNFIKAISQDFDSTGGVQKVKTSSLVSDEIQVTYFQGGKKIAYYTGTENLIHSGIRYVDGAELPAPYNEFEAGLAENHEAFNKFIAANLHYPEEAKNKRKSGTVWLALHILESGALDTIEVANDRQADKILQTEALALIGNYEGGYRAAVDFNGNPIDKWFYLPIRFELVE